jgi:CRP/FNR family transcriptional regulator
MGDIETASLGTCAHRRATAACVHCRARAFSVCAALPDEDLHRLDAIAEHIVVEPGQVLTREGEAQTSVFNITSGSARAYKLTPDGRRQITGFLFAGDFVSLSDQPNHVATVEAVEPLTACRFRKADWRALMAQRRDLEGALLARAGDELAAAQSQMLLLGRKTAIERLASFLTALPANDPARPLPAGHIRLPMTRTEIADYLGLTLETVSRTFGRLKRQGILREANRHDVEVLDEKRLHALADG